jgi:phosphoglycolate phosphatase
MKRTVFLDLDGTLTDNHEGIAGCIRYALHRLGAQAPGEGVLRGCIGPPLRESFARLIDRATPAVIEHAIDAYRERYSTVGWRENVAYAGVHDSLAALHDAGVRLFVCTAKPEIFATRIIAHFGFDAFVERVYGADLSGSLDDKGKLLAHALERERLDPSDCIMVGDRHHDIHAAHANGVRAVGALWGYGTREELAGAHRLLDAPAELASLSGYSS